MLQSLYIKNFALIDQLDITFDYGLNVITGETGAGKSILLGALGVVLGDRASIDLVRDGSEKAIVEAIINISNNKKLLEAVKKFNLNKSGTNEDEMILRREIFSKGQSRCFINDTPTSLSILKAIGDLAIDLHGQHEHQSLLKVESHLELLDSYGNLKKSLDFYRDIFFQLNELKKRLKDLRDKETTLKEKRSLYEYQLNEIKSLSPQPDEIETLQNEERILENAEKLAISTNSLHELLYNDKNSLHDKLAEAKKLLDELSQIDSTFLELSSQAYDALAIVDEINQAIQGYSSKIEFNAERLEHIRERLVALSSIKKKYGGSLANAISLAKNLETELSLVNNFENDINSLKIKLSDCQNQLSQRALELSLSRRNIAQKISQSIEEELAKLGIPNGKFHVDFQHTEKIEGDITIENKTYEATDQGYDKVEFLITANLGEPLRPLVKVASGGEISRMMLALKTILAKSENLPILVFDEIDTGVSGKIAQAVGFSLKDLSRYHQIIVITHLPQIAAMGDTHFLVEKAIQEGRTISSVKKLLPHEKEIEIAKLISGSRITDASRQSAKELIQAIKQQSS